MPNPAIRGYGADVLVALKKETTYGTKPTGNWAKMPFSAVSLGSSRELLRDPVLGQGRDPYAPQQGPVTVDGSITVPVDLRNFGHWLRGLLGAPVSVDQTTNWKHTFKSGAATLPSCSLEVGHTKVGQFYPNVGVVVDSLDMSFSRSGFASATFQLIAQGEEGPNATTSGGTVSELAYLPFNRFQGAVKRAGSSVANLLDASLRFSNNYERVETIRADGKIDGVDPTQASLSGQLKARFSDDTLITAGINNTAVDLEFSYIISATQKLIITCPEVYLPKPKLEVSGPGGVDLTFDFQGAKNTTLGCMMQVELYNDVLNTVYA